MDKKKPDSKSIHTDSDSDSDDSRENSPAPVKMTEEMKQFLLANSNNKAGKRRAGVILPGSK